LPSDLSVIFEECHFPHYYNIYDRNYLHVLGRNGVWSKVPRNLTENYLSSLLQLTVATLSESVGSREGGELK
jgi:hypothetical protein